MLSAPGCPMVVREPSFRAEHVLDAEAGVQTAMPIRKVTVAGINGAIGQPIIHALVAHGFTVQAFTRKINADVSLPANIIETNYDDLLSLRKALTGQDAVVSCLGDTPGAVAAQRNLIEAAITAGVKRFLPSEFGSDTTNAHVRSLPFFEAKVAHQALLEQAALNNPAFSYSLLITGPFLDWGLSVVPFIVNLGTRTAEVIDGGNIPFSITRVPTVATAVASILLRPEQTENRALFIHEGVVTQNVLIASAEAVLASLPNSSATTAHTTTKHINSDIAEPLTLRAYASRSADPLEWIIPSINLSIWAKDAPCHFLHTDNELLGVRELEAEDLEEMVDDEMKIAAQKLGVSEFEVEGDGESGRVEALGRKAFEEGKMKLVSAIM